MTDGLCTQANTFQRLMLQWERFAPYNAGQFMTLDRAFETQTLARAWRQTVISLGLQQIGQHPDAELTATADSLERFISAQMNAEFAPTDSPIRPFVVSEGSLTHAGLIYRHVVADSASIRLVMSRWFDLIQRPDVDKPPFDPVVLMRDCVGGILRKQGFGLVREVLSEVSRLSRLKQVRRLADNDPKRPIIWRSVDLGTGLVQHLVRYARSKKAKVNDLFVAAAAEACDRHLPHELSEARRDLAIGTIVDTRAPGESIHDRFGVSLGVLQSVWRWQQLRDWESILATASACSVAARRRGTALSSTLRLNAAAWHGTRLNRHQLATFYRKRCPIAAGISNVNLNSEWPAAHHPSPLASYTRISPLGPMLPLVFTPTTLGDRLTLGFTYRTHVVSDAVANQVLTSFVDRLLSLA